MSAEPTRWRRQWRWVARMAGAAAGVLACLLATAGPAISDSHSEGSEGAGAAQTWSVQPADRDGADGRASFDYQLAAGESVTDYAQVNNFGDAPLRLRVYSHDALNTPAGAFTLQPADQEPEDVGAWVNLDKQLTVPAGDSEVVRFTLAVPDNATPGDHPGGIVASTTSEATDEKGNPVLVDHRVGARIYLRVAGELAPALQVTRLDADYGRSWWQPFTTGTTTVTYTVTNTGNVRLTGTQQVTVTGLFGWGSRTVKLTDLPEILPGQSITIAGEVDGVWPLLRMSTDVSLQPANPPPFANDPSPSPASARVTVWAMPWPELALLALLGLGVGAKIWQRRRARRRTTALVTEAAATAREKVLKEVRAQADTNTAASTTDGSTAAGSAQGAASDAADTTDGKTADANTPTSSDQSAAEPTNAGPESTTPDTRATEDNEDDIDDVDQGGPDGAASDDKTARRTPNAAESAEEITIEPTKTGTWPVQSS